MAKKIAFLILVIIIAGMSGVFTDRYLFPRLSTMSFFSRYDFLKKSMENVTIINKTEQISVQEDASINKMTSPVTSSVVNILAFQDANNLKPAVQNPYASFTGTIVTSDGIVMAYMPQAEANSKYKVMAYDGNTFDADFYGLDSYSNLAFFKINASNLPVISFADSDNASAGEKIAAIGNSQGFYENSYAQGIISVMDSTYNISGKSISSSEKLEGVFLTNLPKSNAWAGGPAIDYSSQVVGIVGYADRDNNRDFFIIPSNKVKSSIDKAIKKELDGNPELGVYYIPVTKADAISRNLKKDKGALIFSPSGQNGLAVILGKPGAAAGLRINDLVTQVNGEDIDLAKNLPSLLYKHKKGEHIELTVIRDGDEMKIGVQL